MGRISSKLHPGESTGDTMNSVGVAIRYGDVAPEAKENFVPSVADRADFVNLTQLQQYNLQFPNYANPCEYGSVLLDSSMTPFPEYPTDENMGLWSNSITDENGVFINPVVLTLKSNGQYSSQGITLTFDTYNNIFCNDLIIRWYRDDELLDEQDFIPNAAFYFCRNQVENYDKVVITFNSMNMPYNRLKLRVVDYGYGTFFYGEELRNVNLIQEVNPISSEIAINTVDFTLDSKSDMEYSFQSKQPLSVYFNGTLRATTFVTQSKRKAKRQWGVMSEDYVGMLDKITFMGGMYENKNAVELLESIFIQAKVPYRISSTLGGNAVTGHVPICTCRDALMQICFAIGAVVDTSNSDRLNVYELSSDIDQTIPLERTMQGQTFDDGDRVTEVRLTQHTYTKTNEVVEAYSAFESGTGTDILVKFSEPLYNLTISQGTISSSGANYAIITANGGCVLAGRKYEDKTIIKAMKNPIVSASDLENIISINNATLISVDNSDTILQKCYEHLIKTNKISLKAIEGKSHIRYGTVKYGTAKYAKWVFDNPIDVGSIVTAKTEYLGDLTGRVISERYNLNGGILIKECEMI